MAAKFDKEALLKHHFWIVIGLSLVLMLVSGGGVLWGVAPAADEKQKAIEAKQTALTSARPTSREHIEKLEEQKQTVEGRRGKVWEEVYKAQRQADGKDLIHWPEQLDHLNKLYFGDPIPDSERNLFRNQDVYVAEYEKLADSIKPTEFNGGGWYSVLRFVPWASTGKYPTDEDCWLALEDLCVQREVLKCVAGANMMLAKFEAVTDAKELDEVKASLKPTRDEQFGRFVSPYWRLDLAVSRPRDAKAGELKFRGRIKNLSHKRQNVTRVDFQVFFRELGTPNNQPTILPVEAEYLAVGQEFPPPSEPPFEKRVFGSAPELKIHAVVQKLDGRYVPVKRVDQLVMGYHSHRTQSMPLQMTAFSQKAKEAQAATAPVADPNNPTAAPTGGAVSDLLSLNGLRRERYVTRTEQVRRMPIGLVCLVDQQHIQDVLVALTNSPLRFQVTQTHLQRFRGAGGGATSSPGAVFAQPSFGPSVGPSAGPGGIPRDGMAAFGGGGRSGGRGGAIPGAPDSPYQGGQNPGTPPPGATQQVPTGPDVMTLLAEEGGGSLVELAVYGLASLYERYPPKPAEGAAATDPAAATPPATPMP